MVRAVVITVAPPSVSRPAMAAPVPLLPPVTSARRPASESLMVTGIASPSCPACPLVLGPCRRRLVVDDDQPHDAVVADGEVVGEDERVGQPGLVVLAVRHGVDDHLAVMLGGGGGSIVTLLPMISRSSQARIASLPQNSRRVSLTRASSANQAINATAAKALPAAM